MNNKITKEFKAKGTMAFPEAGRFAPGIEYNVMVTREGKKLSLSLYNSISKVMYTIPFASILEDLKKM